MMRIHNINGRKTASLSPLETVRLRSISVASIKLQSLEKKGAPQEEIDAAKEILEATTIHFDSLIKEQRYRKDPRKVR
jgi:hypothetical protein